MKLPDLKLLGVYAGAWYAIQFITLGPIVHYPEEAAVLGCAAVLGFLGHTYRWDLLAKPYLKKIATGTAIVAALSLSVAYGPEIIKDTKREYKRYQEKQAYNQHKKKWKRAYWAFLDWCEAGKIGRKPEQIDLQPSIRKPWVCPQDKKDEPKTGFLKDHVPVPDLLGSGRHPNRTQ